MAKAASGALEVVNYIKVNNLSRVIEKFKKNNFWVIGFDNNANYSNNSIQLPKKCLLIFGAEDKGLRDLTKQKCDQIIKIPIKSNNVYGIESLNVTNACTIGLYEHFKINKK
jgi:23S rRNA (guanosine2251-2'-O)-methyltransferase